jgi:hypothetical protein
MADTEVQWMDQASQDKDKTRATKAPLHWNRRLTP